MSHLVVGSDDYEVCDATARSAGFVDTVNLKNNAVTSGKIADGAVTSGKISDGAVSSGKLASNAVTSGKINNGSVTSTKIADGAVIEDKISSSAVSTSKIADGAVSVNKTDANLMNDLINGLSVDDATPDREDYMITQFPSGGETTKTYHRRKILDFFKALVSGDILTALGFTPANKAGDTFTGQLNVDNKDFVVQNSAEERFCTVETVSGAKVSFGFGGSCKQGLYSTGYVTSLTDPNGYTSSGKWIIDRDTDGKVVVPDWAGVGNTGLPVYFSVTGRPIERSVSSGTATKNTTNAYGNAPTYVKLGRIANVSLFNVGVAVSGINIPLATGLPKPVETQYISIPAQGSQSDYPLVLRIDTTGTLYTANAQFKQNTGYHGQLTYICSE